MVNHIKLISALTLSSLNNNIKRCLSAYLKKRSASCRYNFTLYHNFPAKVYGVPQSAFVFPTLFNFFASTFPQFDNLLINSYADDFTVSCSNSNVALNIEKWVDERGLTISAPNSTITLFTPQFAQSNIHPQVTLNNFLLPLENDTPHTKSNFRSSLQIQCPCQIYCYPGFTPYQHHQGPCWYQLRVSKRKPYLSPICPLSDPFSCMQFLFGNLFPNTSPSLIQKLQIIQNSALA